jgi:hypothetical protein
MGQKLAPFSGSLKRPNILVIGIGTLVFIVVMLLGAKVKRKLRYDQPLPVNNDANYLNWQELDAQIQNGGISGLVCYQVSLFLHLFGPPNISQYRIAYVLDLMESSPGLFSLSNQKFPCDGWKDLGQRYFEEAVILGYINRNNGSTTITELGKQMLVQTRSEGYDKHKWDFVEMRLHETLVADCPLCGRSNITHWYWSDFECSGCRKKISIQDCFKVEIKQASVAARSFLSI